MIRTVAVYARVSTKRAQQEMSLEHQQERLIALAAAKGWHVSEVFVEKHSAWRAGRGAFEDMMAAAGRREFDALLVTARDRWARNVRDSANAQHELEAMGILVLDERGAAVVDHVDYNDPEEWAARGMADVGAEAFSRRQSKKVRDGKRAQAVSGIFVGDVPFGYTRPNPRGGLVPDPVEAGIVLSLFERHSTGAYSLRDEAVWLNDLGMKPHSKRGREFFTKLGVRHILENVVYAGDMTYRGEVLPGDHEPIVPRDLFDVVRGVRPGHRHPRGESAGVFFLSGIGVHAECGSSLWANGKRDGRVAVYRCASRAVGRPDELCTRATGRREEIDAEVARLFESLVLPRDWRAQVEASREAQRAREQAEPSGDRRTVLEARRANVRRALLEELVPYDEAARVLRDLDAQIGALTVRQMPARRVLVAGERLLSVHELWPRMSDEERRECVRLVLQRVEVDLERGQIAAVAPRADFEPLFDAIAASAGMVVRADVLGLAPSAGAEDIKHTTALYVPAWRAA